MIKTKITRIIYLVLMLCIMLALSGCFTEEYDRADIIKYVTKNCDIKKFTVSRDYEEVEGDDGYTDKVWTVTVKGDDKLEFVVHDDFHWGMEALVNSLSDDYKYVVLAYLYEEYDECELLELYEEENISTYAELVGTYDSLDELEELFEETAEFAKYIDECGYDIEFRVNFKMENPLRDNTVRDLTDGDYSTWIEAGDNYDYEEAYEAAVDKYLLTSIIYRFEDKLSEFTDKEIKEAVEECAYRVAVSSDGTEGGEFEYYEDLCGRMYTSAVTFGTLYEILVREGVEVTGDSWHYSFVGAGDVLYEISYDFCDYTYYGEVEEGDEQIGYYYMRNGEKVPMDYYYYNYFWEKDVLEMTGILIDVGKKAQE